MAVQDIEDQRYEERAAEIRLAFIQALEAFTPCDPDLLTDEEIDDISISDDVGIHDEADLKKFVAMLDGLGATVTIEQIQEHDKIKYIIPEVIRG